MTEFNGHKNWTQWNVSLWIYNEEHIYRYACEMRAKYALPFAVRKVQEYMGPRTPDGARVSQVAVRNAIRDILN